MFARVGIALGNLWGDFQQAAVFQPAHGGRGGFSQFEQFAQRQFAALLDDVPDFLLSLGQFWEFAVHRNGPDKQPLAPSGFFAADRLGQN